MVLVVATAIRSVTKGTVGSSELETLAPDSGTFEPASLIGFETSRASPTVTVPQQVARARGSDSVGRVTVGKTIALARVTNPSRLEGI